MNMMRYSPFRGMENLLGQWRWPLDDPEFRSMSESNWMPAVDVSETDKEYLIKVEVPEVAGKDLHVEVENGVLTISGERRKKTEDKKLHRVERFYGHFERSFSLPENVREDDILADQKDGMLYLHLRKSASERVPKKREIKIN
jgi:HSP20 family protein